MNQIPDISISLDFIQIGPRTWRRQFPVSELISTLGDGYESFSYPSFDGLPPTRQVYVWSDLGVYARARRRDGSTSIPHEERVVSELQFFLVPHQEKLDESTWLRMNPSDEMTVRLGHVKVNQKTTPKEILDSLPNYDWVTYLSDDSGNPVSWIAPHAKLGRFIEHRQDVNEISFFYWEVDPKLNSRTVGPVLQYVQYSLASEGAQVERSRNNEAATPYTVPTESSPHRKRDIVRDEVIRQTTRKVLGMGGKVFGCIVSVIFLVAIAIWLLFVGGVLK